MDERITEIRKHLKKKLNPMRYEHTLGVSYTCMALAMRYSANLDQAEMAGLLHDCAKRYDDATIIRMDGRTQVWYYRSRGLICNRLPYDRKTGDVPVRQDPVRSRLHRTAP